MQITPIAITVTLENTLRSSSAPLSTKNTTKSGAVHLSTRSMISAEKSQILQNTVPSIMHTSRLEKPSSISVPGISILTMASATVNNTKVMEIPIRLVLEWNHFSNSAKMNPMTNPSRSDPATSSIGFTSTVITSIDAPE